MRILHVFRSPVGGLFRHVRDLARGQKALGHDVGLFCDSQTGGALADSLLTASEPHCTLGIKRVPISRLPSFGDLKSVQACTHSARDMRLDVIHGHGAKGGLLARLAARRLGIASVYTPHGGSLHYEWRSFAGALFLGSESLISRMSSGFVFVCNFEKSAFDAKIGIRGKPSVVVHNGLWPEEFAPALANINATDLLFVGEVRHLKGIDILLEALAVLNKTRTVTLTVVGDGLELDQYTALADELGLSRTVMFVGRKSIREAFRLGRVLVMPSRNESFPYVVLEAAAAGVPIIASAVGGIPEILPPSMLCASPEPYTLAHHIDRVLARFDQAQAEARGFASALIVRIGAGEMARKTSAFYTTLVG